MLPDRGRHILLEVLLSYDPSCSSVSRSVMTLKSAGTIKQTNQMNYLYYGVSQIGAHFFTIIDRIGNHFTALFLMRCYMRKLNY